MENKTNENTEQAELEMQENEEDNKWTSCCLVCNRHAVTFFTQVGIIGIVMIFCIVKLSLDNTPEIQQTYLSLLTFLAGIAAPQPKFKNK